VYVCAYKMRRKGTKKNVYAQENVNFIAVGYIFLCLVLKV
jgi:hypothetical protein